MLLCQARREVVNSGHDILRDTLSPEYNQKGAKPVVRGPKTMSYKENSVGGKSC